MSFEAALSGGCQCGAVRYRAARMEQYVVCHCRMCQKAFGNYFAPLVVVDGLEWTRGEPSFFRSSNKARRGFCAECGTPLCYLGEDGTYEMSGGSFDDPSFAVPEKQINTGARLAVYDTLPDIPHQTNLDGEASFNASVVTCQHPDHDTSAWPMPKGGDDA